MRWTSKIFCMLQITSMLLLFSACTGTDSTELETITDLASTTNTTTTTVTTSGGDSGGGTTTTYEDIVFTGISSATTLSDTKIQVEFSPATGGSGVFSYKVYLDSDFSTSFKTFTGSEVTSTDQGTLQANVSGLTASTGYTLSVRAYDALQGLSDDNIVTATATTNASSGTFAGLDSIGSATSSTLTLNWTAFAGASGYKIYNTGGASPTYVATASSGATSYQVTGLTPNTSYTYRVQVFNSNGYETPNTKDVTESTAAVIDFDGATSITQVTTTTLRINWTHVADAQIYRVYNITSGTPLLIGTVNAPTPYYDVTGLTGGQSYIFRVRAQDADGNEDDNTANVSQTMPSTTVTFNGWTNAKATGPREDYAGTEIEAGVLELAWKESTSGGGAITGYNLYRSTTLAGSYTKINGSTITGVVGEDLTYAETVGSLTEGTAYYYKVSVIIGGNEYFHEATNGAGETDHTTIRVIYPQANMGFVHRWIANQDMCDEIGRGIGDAGGVEIAKNYRCPYDGFASSSGYYDLGYDLMVDLQETSCNFSRSACTSHSHGATVTTDCIDDAAPDGSMQAAQNSVFYSTANNASYCYLQTDANPATPNWVRIGTMTASTDLGYTGNNYGSYFYGNIVNGAPLNQITQSQAWHTCQTQTQSLNIEGVAYNYRKRLLRNKEWTAAAQWNPTLSASDIATLETSTAGNGCYPNPTATTDLDYTSYHWPHTNSYNSRYYVTTGTSHTQNCRSRYGMSQMSGNVYEFISDQFYISANRQGDFDVTPTFDTDSKEDWKNHSTGDYLVIGQTTTPFHAYWSHGNNVAASGRNYFNPMIGLALDCNYGLCNTDSDDNTLVTMKTTGATINNYLTPMGARAILYNYSGNTTNGSYYGLLKGGRYNAGNINHTTTIRPSQTNFTFGMRCMFPVSH